MNVVGSVTRTGAACAFVGTRMCGLMSAFVERESRVSEEMCGFAV